jgi:hypothetical protein
MKTHNAPLFSVIEEEIERPSEDTKNFPSHNCSYLTRNNSMEISKLTWLLSLEMDQRQSPDCNCKFRILLVLQPASQGIIKLPLDTTGIQS